MTSIRHPTLPPDQPSVTYPQSRSLPQRRALPRPPALLFWVICQQPTPDGTWTFRPASPDTVGNWTELTYGATDQCLGPALDPFAVAAPDKPALAMLITTADHAVRPILLPLEQAVIAINAEDQHPAFLVEKLLPGTNITLTPQTHDGLDALRIDADLNGSGQGAQRRIDAWIDVAADAPAGSRLLIDDRDWRGFAIQAAIGSGVGTPADLNVTGLLAWDQAMGLIMHVGESDNTGDIAVTPEAGERFALFIDCADQGKLVLIRTEAVLQAPQQVRILAQTVGPARNQPTHTLNP